MIKAAIRPPNMLMAKFNLERVIADQLPTKMAPEVIKNTVVKIGHQLTAEDDRNLLGGTM